MYTPRALFPRLFFKICFFVLSLYTVGRLVTLPYEISFESPSLLIRDRGKVWSAYIHTVKRIIRCWDMAVWSFPRWPPAAILNLIQPEMAPFDPSSPKTPPRTKHEEDRLTRCIVMAIWNFPKMCEWALRSVVGRQYSYFLHWSHILLFRYVRDVAREE